MLLLSFFFPNLAADLLLLLDSSLGPFGLLLAAQRLLLLLVLLFGQLVRLLALFDFFLPRGLFFLLASLRLSYFVQLVLLPLRLLRSQTLSDFFRCAVVTLGHFLKFGFVLLFLPFLALAFGSLFFGLQVCQQIVSFLAGLVV